MAEIIGIRFKRGGKIYYFSPNDEDFEVGSFAIVETIRGTECGEVVMSKREIDNNTLNHELKTVIRKANQEDLKRVEENKKKAERAFAICNEKIKAHGLEMNLLDVEYTFDNNKILFSFSADGRVDFRELVKDLAGVFRARIELRQIGVRDEAKMLGGLGVCGRPFCCKQFMGEFQSVSIKMAKEQGLSLNPVKISGTCGRLMCCLKHEQDAYEYLIRETPRIGSSVLTPDGTGVVVDQELIAGRVKVRLDNSLESVPKAYRVSDLKKNGEGNESQISEDEYINSMHSKYDIPESDEEKEMLSELEEMEYGEQPVSNKRRPHNGNKPNFKPNDKSNPRAGKPREEREPKAPRENNEHHAAHDNNSHGGGPRNNRPNNKSKGGKPKAGNGNAHGRHNNPHRDKPQAGNSNNKSADN